MKVLEKSSGFQLNYHSQKSL